MSNQVSITGKTFLEGPAGNGKTTYATRYLLRLLESGIAPDKILVLVPQVTLGRPYQLAIHDSPVVGGMVNILTVAGIARQAIETYWPIVAGPMGFADPNQEPTFLNIETAQYFMARLATPVIDAGQFDGVSMAKPRIISQVLDDLNRAAMLRFPLDEVAQRLINAWGDRHSSRPPVYKAAIDLAHQFRAYCLQNNLLDFSLQIEAFNSALRSDSRFTDTFLEQYDYLIADNIEEDNPAGHDFIRWLLPHLDGGLLVYDSDAGYRFFLGAEPDLAYDLKPLCDTQRTMAESHIASPAIIALGQEFNRSIGPTFEPPAEDAAKANPLTAFRFEFHRYYPQMIEWTADQIIGLVQQGTEPRQIAVLAPYLSDSLRFALNYRLHQAGIQTLSHRPSRALHDESVTRALLTLAALAHPEWSDVPPMLDVADTLSQVINGLDPVRARLLAQIVFRPTGNVLSSFEVINADMRQRITYLVGERFEALREWLTNYRQQRETTGTMPLDHFWSRLFGEILAQPGYRFHTNLEAGRISAQLIASAQRFRHTLYDDQQANWDDANREYLALVNQRLLSALFAQSWQDEESNAVFLSPAFTFLMRNRFVDYQFWIDAGSNSWSERLEQPLTHPYVLRRSNPADMFWSDDMEDETQRELLYKVVIGLIRRCRRQIFLGIADLGESGFEQRGMLLRIFQEILRRNLPAANDQEVA